MSTTSFVYFTDVGSKKYWKFLERTFLDSPFEARFGGHIQLLPSLINVDSYMKMLDEYLQTYESKIDWNVINTYGLKNRKEVLEKARKTFSNPDAVSTGVTWHMCTSFEKMYRDNIVIILRNHFGTSPRIAGHGTMQLHYIGRGLVGYGGSTHIEKTNHFGSDLYPYHFKEFGEETEKKYLLYVAKHEIIGHQMLGLSDHYSKEGRKEKCLMVPAVGLEELKERLINDNVPNSVELCEECSEKINQEKK